MTGNNKIRKNTAGDTTERVAEMFSHISPLIPKDRMCLLGGHIVLYYNTSPDSDEDKWNTLFVFITPGKYYDVLLWWQLHKLKEVLKCLPRFLTNGATIVNFYKAIRGLSIGYSALFFTTWIFYSCKVSTVYIFLHTFHLRWSEQNGDTFYILFYSFRLHLEI